MGPFPARTRSLLAFLCFALLACEAVSAQHIQQRSGDGLEVGVARRADNIDSIIGGDATTTTSSSSTSSTADKTTATTTSTTSSSSSSSSSSTSTSSSSSSSSSDTKATATNTGTSTQPTNTQTSSSKTSSTATTAQATGKSSESVFQTTNAEGATVSTTVYEQVSDTASAAATSTSAASSSSDDSSGLGTGSIIGLSVAGGVAVIGVVSFFIWKFTRKRYGDFDDDPIKWPELNAHDNEANYAMPASTSKGAGLDSASEANLNRNPSGGGYSQSAYSQPVTAYSHASAADSTADLYAPGGDPYAVPPLPHLNPNTPYRDDPNFGGQGAYYDPYRGPVPQAFNDAASIHSNRGYGGPIPGAPGEAIPMSNLNPGVMMAQSGRMSPGPQMAMAMNPGSRAASPQPGSGLAYPGTAAMVSGRVSPGPGAAYGGAR